MVSFFNALQGRLLIFYRRKACISLNTAHLESVFFTEQALRNSKVSAPNVNVTPCLIISLFARIYSWAMHIMCDKQKNGGLV